MSTTTQATQEASMAFKQAQRDDAARRTWERLASEHGGTAYLSADIVATDEQDNPIVSVIHLDDRRHWNLVVSTNLPNPGDVSATAFVENLPDVLDRARDGELILVVGERGWWTLGVEVLEPAKL